MSDRSTSTREPPLPRAPSVDGAPPRLRARWDAAVPTLVATGSALLAFLGTAYSAARPS
ncbi:hypothetical protein [Frigoribacterium salinisoli]